MLATNTRDLAIHLREGECSSDATAAEGRGLPVAEGRERGAAVGRGLGWNCGNDVSRCMPLIGVGCLRSWASAVFVVVIHC